jgi:tripeptide aminopeptidase
VAIAALAIAELHRDGWHGDVTKQGRHGTSNVGVIHGGAATNVVTDAVELRAEVRSHDPEFRKEMLAAFQTAFARAAESVRNIDGRPGAAEVVSRLDYEAFLLAEDEPAVRAAQAAIRAIGREPRVVVSNGGLDANWMTAHGIPTVTMGCGQESVHTTSERLNVGAFENACRVALRLATGTESEGSGGGEAGR